MIERKRQFNPRDGAGPTTVARPPTARSSPAPPDLVQRACACGNGAPSGIDDQCDTCRERALSGSPPAHRFPGRRRGRRRPIRTRPSTGWAAVGRSTARRGGAWSRASGGVPPAELSTANPGLTDGAFPPTVRLPGCREHIVMGYSTAAPAPVESVAETRAQIAAQNGVTTAMLDRANPDVAARGGWGTLPAGTSVLIPRH
jgi:hypothetical protein